MGALYIVNAAMWCRQWGLDVTEAPGWQTRGRSSGGFDDIRAIGQHHDAISNTSYRLEHSIPLHAWVHQFAPVGNFVIERLTGRIGVIAAGATNTQGKGGPMSTSRGVIPLDAGNRYMISIEAQNNGVGEPWSDDMLDAYVTLCAALIDGLARDGAYDARTATFRQIKLDPRRDQFAHFEYAPTRKIDPASGRNGQDRFAISGDRYGRWNMDRFRDDVADLLTKETRPMTNLEAIKLLFPTVSAATPQHALDIGKVEALLTLWATKFGFDIPNTDGTWTPLLTDVVKAFQSSRGIKADGVVGPVTWCSLLGKDPNAQVIGA